LGLYGRDVRVAVVTARPALDIAINQWARGFRATNVDDLRTLLRLVADGAVVLVDLDDDARRHVLTVLRDHGVADPVVVMTASGGVPTEAGGGTGETEQDADHAEDHLHNTVLVSRTAPMQEVANALAAAHNRDLTRVHGYQPQGRGTPPAGVDGRVGMDTEAAPAREGAWAKWWRMLTAVPEPAPRDSDGAEGLDHAEVRASEGSGREAGEGTVAGSGRGAVGADEETPAGAVEEPVAEGGTEPVADGLVVTDEETVIAPGREAIGEPDEETVAERATEPVAGSVVVTDQDTVIAPGRETIGEPHDQTAVTSGRDVVGEPDDQTAVKSGEDAVEERDEETVAEAVAEPGEATDIESGDEKPAEAGTGGGAESGEETAVDSVESREQTAVDAGGRAVVEAGRGTVAESDDPGDAVELEVLLEGDHHAAAAGRQHVLDALRSDAVRRAAAAAAAAAADAGAGAGAGAGALPTTGAPRREADPSEGERRREPLVLTDAAACAWVLLDELAPSYLDGAASVMLRGSGNTFATVAASGILPEEGITRVPFGHELVRALLQRDGAPVLASTERAGTALADVPLSRWPWLLAVLLPGHDGPAGMLLVGRPLPFAAGEVERLVRTVQDVPNLLERAAAVRAPAAEAARAHFAALAAAGVAGGDGRVEHPIGATTGTDSAHDGSAPSEAGSEVVDALDGGASTPATGADAEGEPDRAAGAEAGPEVGAEAGDASQGWSQRLTGRLRATVAAVKTDRGSQEPRSAPAPARRSPQPGVTSEAASASWALLDGVLPFVEDGGAVVALRGSGGWYVPVAATRVQALVGAEVVPVAHPLVGRLVDGGRVMGVAGLGADMPETPGREAAERATTGLGVTGPGTTTHEPDQPAAGARWLAGVPLRERPALLVAAIGPTEAPDGVVIIGRTRPATDDELGKLASVVEEWPPMRPSTPVAHT
jgi:hypothetical protein